MKMQIAVSVLVVFLLTGCLPEGIQLPDNNATTEQHWYPDEDGDGYGIAANEYYGLKPGPNWAANPLDCDDTNAALNPGRTETPNGIDDDCDVVVDEHWMYVFVTTTTIGAIGDGGGYDGGGLSTGPNKFCNDQKGSLPGTYRAWIARAGSDPLKEMTQPPANISYDYVLLDGTIVANDWADLVDGTLDHAINMRSDGSIYSGYVWTSVNTDGSYNTSNDNDNYFYGHCEFWGMDDQYTNANIGRVGHSDAVDAGWTVQSGFHDCNNQYAVYCVRQSDY